MNVWVGPLACKILVLQARGTSDTTVVYVRSESKPGSSFLELLGWDRNEAHLRIGQGRRPD